VYCGEDLAIMKTLLSIVALTFTLTAIAADNMKAFPPAEQGMTRFVIPLPEQKNEDALKVELVIGKTVQVDAHNRYFFGGKLETETIQGWGFDRYILRKLGPMAGTLMAVDPNSPKVDRFIAVGGEPNLLRYNSRLPIVVYVPTGVEVRYRIWRADETPTPAKEG
jgi:ecotin